MIDPSNAALGMLPPPRIPRRPSGPTAADLAYVVGEELTAPLRAAEAIFHDAASAVYDLEAHRPGASGTKWRAALEEDAADYAAGRTRATWRVAELLAEDPQRWATARLKCGAVPVKWRDLVATLDREAIAKKCRQRMADAGRRFESAAADGWAVRDDPHAAWPRVGEGKKAITDYRAGQTVLAWLEGTERPPLTDEYTLAPNVAGLPGSAEAAGMWICLDLVLNPKKKLLGIPNGPKWPQGAERLLGHAIPAGGGLSELMTGRHHEIVGAD